MIRLLLISSLILILNSCYSHTLAPYKSVNLNDGRSLYKMVETYKDNLEQIRLTAKNHAPYGYTAYSYSATVFENDEIRSINSAHYLGYGNSTQEAIKRSLEVCNKTTNHLKTLKLMGKEAPSAKIAKKVKKCKTIITETFQAKKTQAEIDLDKIMLSHEQTCKNLGIKKNSDDYLKCINELYSSSLNVQNNSSISISDLILGLLLLDTSLSSLQTTSNSSVNCFLSSIAMTGSGGLNGVICN